MHRLFARILPIINLAIIVLIMIVGFILFSWLVIFGALFALGVYLYFLVRTHFFDKQSSQPEQRKHTHGVTYEHDEID